jgi:hypothetical protein
MVLETANLSQTARAIGTLFLLGLVSVGFGEYNLHVAPRLGALFMFGKAGCDICVGVLLFPALRELGEETVALGYLVSRLCGAIVTAIGVVAYLAATADGMGECTTSYVTFAKLKFFSSQAAILAVAAGSVPTFAAMHHHTALLPHWLSFGGAIAYAILGVGATAEILGSHLGGTSLAPAGLFEMTCGIWLIVKGFA